MGYALQWLAVKGKAPALVLDELDLTGTGEFEDIPDSPLTGATLPGGWYVVTGHHFLGQFPIERISRGCEVVTCGVEEHVMYSFAEGWKDGQQIWSINHDSSRGIQHLEAKGDLPRAFELIRDRLLAEQQAEGAKPEVDFVFDIPVEVAQSLTAFRHDKDLDGVDDDPFEVLEIRRRARSDSAFGRLLAALGFRRQNP